MHLTGKDCVYLGDTGDLLWPVPISRLLVVGTAGTDDHSLAPQVRRASLPPVGMEVVGRFAFQIAGNWLGVLVRHGRPEEPAAFSARQLEDSHWCMQTRSWSQYLWDNATPVIEPTRFTRGDQVQLVGADKVGTVVAANRLDGRSVYQVWFSAGDTRSLGDESLEPFVFDDSDPLTWVRAGASPPQVLARTLTYTKLTHALTDTVYSYRSSRTIHRPYQFRPVLRLIDGGPQRLLIADEVGLGKTIEAGLIWNELEQRTDMRRVLVVCPANLVHKWRAEMDRRFDRKLAVLDRAGLRELVSQLELGDADTPVAAVASLEMLRNSQELESLTATQPRFDLVIVDEAHYLRNRGTRSYALGELLGDWAEALIFLSATPLNLGSHDLFTLMHLLRPETFPDRSVFATQIEPNRHLTSAASMLISSRERPRKVATVLRGVEDVLFSGTVTERMEYRRLLALLERDEPLTWEDVGEARRLLLELNVLSSALTRTRKVDVPDAKAVREPVQIDVGWTTAERDLYDAVLRLCRSKAAGSGRPAGFVMQMPLRQAASCLPATVQWLHDRHGTTTWSDVVDDGVSDLEVDSEELPDAVDDVDGDALAQVFMAAREIRGIDTKFKKFREALLEAQRHDTPQVMVFSFFRRTLEYLERQLNPEFRVRVMHGGTPMADRPEIIDSFRRGEFDVLLVSEVGSEGLDFEFCNVLVNYDLPWNPMRVEQRIGRLDRFGQRHEKIFIYNFHVPGTIETDIYERLYDRINVFRESIGELEPILREGTNDLAAVVMDPQLSPDQRARRLAEIEVAWTDRERDLDRLRESEGLLAGLDDLLVDGLERDLNERGRFIGAAELTDLVTHVVTTHGGSVKPSSSGDLQVRGTDQLAVRLSADGSGGGSRMGVAELKNACYYERAFTVTFDGETAGTGNTEYVGVRHPLVRAAISDLQADKRPLARYAVVSVPHVDVARPTLVQLSLAETTGLRPQLELHPVSMELDSHEERPDVGFALLQGLASGALAEHDQEPSVSSVVAAVRHAQEQAERQRFQWERERSETNASLVDARIAAQTAAIDVKVRQAESTLALVAGKDARLTRMYESRIRNLTARRTIISDELTHKRSLAVTLRPVAVAVVMPTAR